MELGTMTKESVTASTRKKRLRHFIRKLFDIRSDTMNYNELNEMMEENTIIHGSNMWILIMAILVASIGLNVNSTAVIIGAMLISPLMNGILTMGYSLAAGNLTMLRKAFAHFGIQVVISLITSTIYFCISPLTAPTSEMIARTNPTQWDVLIALFGGIAGAIGNTRQKKSNVIPGVAIATALMPPLCTVGYGIATLQLRFIFGAFYLFTINTMFIMLSAAMVTKLLRIPVHKNPDAKKQKQIRCLIILITAMTVVPSGLAGTYMVYQEKQQEKINNTEAVTSEQPDCNQLSEDAISIFDKLSSCSCGIMSGPDGEYILLTGTVTEALSAEEEDIIRNWLTVESGLSHAELLINS